MQTRRSFLRTSLAATTAILADVSSIAAKERPAVSKSGSDASLDGVKFLTPELPDYAIARQVYNAGIVTQPKVIASCISEIDVQRAIERAKAESWPIAVKAGGHSFEGFCLNDDGLVVSVSPMREMQLDPKTGILTAGAGCRLEEVNKFLLAKGRFLPAGSCRTVGLAGLTLGGGYGMFHYRFARAKRVGEFSSPARWPNKENDVWRPHFSRESLVLVLWRAGSGLF